MAQLRAPLPLPRLLPRLSVAVRLLVPLWLAALAGCTPADPIVTGAAHPPMWLVRDADTMIILIGAVHQLPPDLDWQDARVERAVADADELWLELAPDEVAKVPTLFAATSHDEPVPSLDRRLGRDAAERVIDLANIAGIDETDAQRSESWALALAVGQVSSNDAGLSSEAGVETWLTRRFADAGKPVRGLESAAGQLTLFDALPDTMQDRVLADTVAQARQARALIHTTIRAWAAGDGDAIARMSAHELARTPGLAEPLLYSRNRAWAATLAGRMQRPGTVLVAVGAGHLVGEQSLPDLLTARGLRVTRMMPRVNR
jgi:hypothetical protein